MRSESICEHVTSIHTFAGGPRSTERKSFFSGNNSQVACSRWLIADVLMQQVRAT